MHAPGLWVPPRTLVVFPAVVVVFNLLIILDQFLPMGVAIVSLFRKLRLTIHRGQEFTQNFNTMAFPGTALCSSLLLICPHFGPSVESWVLTCPDLGGL